MLEKDYADSFVLFLLSLSSFLIFHFRFFFPVPLNPPVCDKVPSGSTSRRRTVRKGGGTLVSVVLGCVQKV